MYINVHSSYSLRYGILSIEELIDFAKQKNINELTLTDINNSTGALEFYRACKKENIKANVGIEFRNEKHELLYFCIAKNHDGFKQLNDFLTWHNIHKTPLPEKPWYFADAFVVYPFGYNEVLEENEFVGIRYLQLNKLFKKNIQAVQPKLLLWHPVTFQSKLGIELHRYLRAIDHNVLLSRIPDGSIAEDNEYLMPMEELHSKYQSYDFILKNTEQFLAQCNFHFDFNVSKNKKLFGASKEDDKSLLTKLAYDGLEYRYGKKNKQAIAKINHELEVIDNLGFAAYFLITWDIIRYSMSRGYYHIGRGSGANSIVAYCLRITDVDPIELDLYFERFLNPKRTSPPDFDIDYSWDERDEVLDYIFKRYGRNHTALLGTMSTFKDRSTLRELGKVEGLPKAEIDQLVHPAPGFTRSGNILKRIETIGTKMQNMPNQRSIHAGGVLISELPITCYTALDLPPKGLPTVQWDMYISEDIGFEKFDILSQRGIGHIKEAVNLIKRNRNISIDIHAVQKFKTDPKVNAQLKSGDTIGCFYIESPAMRGLLKKLKCETYIILVAASSIIRPGVAKSGMMKQYISNFHNPNNVNYLHPVMKEQLEETFGVMVFQEDVIKVCHHFAGLDLADADVLRRAMSGKFRSRTEFDKLVEKFFANAKSLGRDLEITNEVWRQVSSFAGYSFSKAHSASYAVESYQSLFLKTYYPQEFMVAVLNNYGGFYSRWLYVHEARRSGATIHLPCVNNSLDRVNISGKDVYLGFIGILGFQQENIEAIPAERLRNGPYKDLEDLIKRIDLSLDQAVLLIRVGALRFTGCSKKELLWEVYNYLGHQRKESGSPELFYTHAKKYDLPAFVNSKAEDAFDEIELLDFPVSMSYFELVSEEYKTDIVTDNLIQFVGQTISIVGCFVADKTVRTVTNKRMYFGTFIDIEGNFFDTTHFPNSATSYPFKGRGCYLIKGKVVEEFGFPSIEVKEFRKLENIGNPKLLEKVL